MLVHFQLNKNSINSTLIVARISTSLFLHYSRISILKTFLLSTFGCCCLCLCCLAKKVAERETKICASLFNGFNMIFPFAQATIAAAEGKLR